MSRLPLRARAFLPFYRGLRLLERPARRLLGPLRVLASAAWLGLLDREVLAALDERCYDHDLRYLDVAYNRQGLWPWEQRALERHFPSRGRLLVTSAGGGREVVALRRLGYEVGSFECHERLRALANRILAEDGLDTTVLPSPRDVCPEGRPPYDGAVVGWGSYTLVKGSSRRVALLDSVRRQLRPGAPALLSFFAVRPGSERWFRLTARVAGTVARLRGGEPPELGDVLDPNFQHYFPAGTVEAELQQAGLELVALETAEYAHAVARVTSA